MKQSVKATIWAIAIVLVLGGAFVGYRLLKENYDQNQQMSSQTASMPSSQAASTSSLQATSSAIKTSQTSDFTVYDADGNKVALSSKFGKPIVLNFWATWCGPCRAELPDFNKVSKELGDKVQFFMVNVDDPGTEADVKNFLTENGYTFPVYYDTDYDGIGAYNVTGIPVTYFINADGQLAATQRGTISEDTLRANIDKITE